MAVTAFSRRSILIPCFLFEGGLLAIAAVLGWLLHRPFWQQLRWEPSQLASAAAATVLMVGCFFVCMHSTWRPLARIRRISHKILAPLFAPCTILDLALVSALAGIGEEALFRGVVQEQLSGWLGPWLALGVASLLFGLVHAITPGYVLLAAAFGAILGTMWLQSHNLLAPILAHGLYDFIALVILTRDARRDHYLNLRPPSGTREQLSVAESNDRGEQPVP
jgi:membrane protease YdiL (CAAX protease family)